jgi:hypothetical protein
MPEGYLKMKRAFMKEGMSEKAAQAKAARIWNSKHPNNPVGRHRKTLVTR